MKGQDLINKREQVMDLADRALDAAWPERKGPEFERAMRSAAQELESICRHMSDEGVSKLEQSRTYRYLGSVYSDLAPALGKEMLLKAKETYEHAESLLAGVSDEFERAKLNFNFGNTLRQIDPNDVQLLSQAQHRLLAARSYFAVQAPKYLTQVDSALVSVENLLKIAPLSVGIQNRMKSMQKLQDELAEGGDPGRIAGEMKELMKREGGVHGAIAQIEALIAELAPKYAGNEKLAEARRQLETVSASVLNRQSLTGEQEKILSTVRKRLESEASKGNLSKDRAESLGQILDQFTAGLAGGGDDLGSMISSVNKTREFISSQFELNHYLSHGVERPPVGSRAATLVELNWHMRRFLLEEMARPDKGTEESKEVLELNVRAAKVDRRIYEAGADDALALRIQKEAFLPLARAVRNFSARSYAMPVRPIWPAAKVQAETCDVYYSGPITFRSSIGSLSRRLGLELMPEPRGRSLALARWEQLQTAVTAIFDLRAKDGAAKAAVAYELGVALTIGKPVVVLTAAESGMPFDVDVDPVVLKAGSPDESDLASAIDRSLVSTYPRPRMNCAATTLAYVVRRYPRPLTSTYADQTVKVLSELGESPDGLVVSRTVTKLFEYLEDGTTTVVHPAWSPVYPAEDEVRMFHVMPFRPKWATEVAQATENLCKKIGATYVRGDKVEDPSVIRSIWEGICRASHVLVDLTGFNPNVALELGIAHTLGKNLLVVGQQSAVENLFPMVSKSRLHVYETERLDETYLAAVRTFLSKGNSGEDDRFRGPESR